VSRRVASAGCARLPAVMHDVDQCRAQGCSLRRLRLITEHKLLYGGTG
jgi:hypothetical protein